jgi:hypothetical protein
MTMKIRRVIVSTLSFVLTASPLAAQTVATSSPAPQPVLTTAATTTPGTTVTGSAHTTATPSAYESLSIGNRKIARALFEAQKTETPPAGTDTSAGSTTTTGTGTTSTSENLTLDQIAGLKQSGQGWGQVFKAMQARGLVTEKNLGQVVSRYGKQHSASRAETTTASNRPDGFDAKAASAEGAKADRSSVGAGHGHAKQSGTTVTARGSDFRGNGGGNGGGGGNGNGNGKTK